MRIFAYNGQAWSRPVNWVPGTLTEITRRRLGLARFVGLAGVLMAPIASAPLTTAQAAELVMIEEAGCPWCDRWDEDIGVVYEKTAEGRAAPLRRIDIADPLPDDLTFLQKGRYTPTFILVSEGREFGRIRGYPGEDFFWPMLQELLERLPEASDQSHEDSTAEDGS